MIQSEIYEAQMKNDKQTGFTLNVNHEYVSISTDLHGCSFLGKN